MDKKSYSGQEVVLEKLEKAGRAILTVTLVIVPFLVFPYFYDLYILPKAFILRIGVMSSAALALSALSFRTSNIKAPIFFAFWALALLAVLTTVFSDNWRLSFFGNYLRGEGLLTYLTYIAIAPLVMFYYRKQEQKTMLVKGIVWSVLTVSLFGMGEYLGLYRIRSGQAVGLERLASTLGNPDFLGIFLVMLLPIVFYVAFTAKRGYRTIAFLTIFAGLIAVYLSASRAAILAAVIVIPFVVLVLINKRRSPKHLLPVSVTLSFLIIAGFMILSSGRYSWQSFQNGFVERRLNMESSLNLIAEKPVSGYGLDTYILNSSRFGNVVAAGSESLFDRPHNGLIYTAYALGIPGLILFLWLAAFFLIRGWRSFASAEDDRGLTAVLLASAIAYLVTEMSLFSTPGTTPYFFMTLGLLGRQSLREVRPRIIAANLAWLKPAAFLLVIFLPAVFFSTRQVAADMAYKKGWTAGDKGTAAFHYERAISLFPWNPDYYDNLTRLYIDSGKPEWLPLAFSVIAKGKNYFPQEARLLLASGNTNLSLGRAADAKKDFLQAVNYAGGDGIVHWALATAYLQEQNYAAAIDSLKQALVLNPGLTGAHDLLEQVKKEALAKQSPASN